MNNDNIKSFIDLDFSSFSKYLNNLSPLEFSTLGSLIGLIMIQGLSVSEQNSLGNFFELIGQVLLTSASQAQLQDPDLSLNDFLKFQERYNNDISYLLNKIKNNKF